MRKGAKKAGLHNEGNVIVNNSKEKEKCQQKKPIWLHKKLSEYLKPKGNRNGQRGKYFTKEERKHESEKLIIRW